jgi:hypothetical protein
VLATEKDARLTTEQALKDFDEVKAHLTQELETAQATCSATHDKLESKSRDLDDMVIFEQKANKLSARAEEKLATAVTERKILGQSLESAQKALSKREGSSTVMISTVVANALALLKSHMPDLNVELLRKDFVVDEATRETLTSNAYTAAYDFVLSYDFSSLAEFKDDCDVPTLHKDG